MTKKVTKKVAKKTVKKVTKKAKKAAAKKVAAKGTVAKYMREVAIPAIMANAIKKSNRKGGKGKKKL